MFGFINSISEKFLDFIFGKDKDYRTDFDISRFNCKVNPDVEYIPHPGMYTKSIAFSDIEKSLVYFGQGCKVSTVEEDIDHLTNLLVQMNINGKFEKKVHGYGSLTFFFKNSYDYEKFKNEYPTLESLFH